VAVLIGSLAGAPAVVAMQRIRRWWLPLWLGSIPAIVLLVIIAPVLLDPIFNRFEPLRDQDLKEELLDLASRAGIEGGRVFQVDKSKQTTTMNAYVTGIGPTKRIVMWDTLLQKMTREEVVSVMGHEMGHYVLHHVWKGVALAVAGVLAALLVAHAVYARARIDARDMATFPWLLVILTVLLFLGSPVAAGFSRHLEHEADVFALDLTGLGVPMATAFVKLAEDTKINPDPHPVIEFWRYSHPSLKKRVEFALSAGRRAGGVGPYRSR
jgi:Zn-dependent protease with chaperone function